jgi:hypothetical protein
VGKLLPEIVGLVYHATILTKKRVLLTAVR